jgi:hypothetical protein
VTAVGGVTTSQPLNQPPVATSAPLAVPVPVTPVAPADTNEAPATEAPVAPKSRRRPANDEKRSFENAYTRALNNLEFLKIGKAGCLHLSGASNHLKKNPDGVYNILARVYGSKQEVKEFLSNPNILEVLKNKGVNVDELHEEKWNVTAENINDVSADTESLYNQEVSRYKTKQTVPVSDVSNLSTEFSNLLTAYKAQKGVNSKPSDATVKIQLKMKEAGSSNKVLDVSKTTNESISYKTISRPTPGGNSQNICVNSIPVCANKLDSLRHFLTLMNYSPSEVSKYISEWNTNNNAKQA